MFGSPEDMEHSHYEACLARQRQANHDASDFELRARQQQALVGQRNADLRANFNSLNIRLPRAAESTARKHNFRAAACSIRVSPPQSNSTKPMVSASTVAPK
jgi:hypothetical protein